MFDASARKDDAVNPAWVDVQVNGAYGVDFNTPGSYDLESFEQVCEALQAEGVSKFLPTIITGEAMEEAIGHLVGIIESSAIAKKSVVGIHVEGPFLNPNDGFRGAHPLQSIRACNLVLTGNLLDSGRGYIRMWTLAPELEGSTEVIRLLTRQGVRVFAGHSDATRDQLRLAVDDGVVGFTHLGNGCPALLARHDNIIHRVLSLKDELYISLIGDGFHLPPWYLRELLGLLKPTRTILTTDRIAIGENPRENRNGCELKLGSVAVESDAEGNPRTSGGLFAGSVATMRSVHDVVESIFPDAADSKVQWFGGAARKLFSIESRHEVIER